MPNITGSWQIEGSIYKEYSGAFYGGAEYLAKPWGGSTGEANTACFDASRSNAIYGNSNTVQPTALTARFYIKF